MLRDVDSWLWEGSEDSDKGMLVQTVQTAEIKTAYNFQDF